jgi:uncharacterized protein (TIGR01777 family)
VRYLITGGSGLIGTHLCRQLLAAGNHVTVISRYPERLCSRNDFAVQAVASLSELPLDYFPEVVINLAGAPIAATPWTAARRRMLWHSRVDETQRLVEWIKSLTHLPDVMLSASAVGYYGDNDEHVLDENTQPAPGFSHDLCHAWEQQALLVESSGVRVCIMRFGVVLSRDGGFLSRMKLPFLCGLGGRMGGGQQWFSWVHIDDLLSAMQFLIHHQTLSGVFNVTSPKPVRNSELTSLLARQYGRPAVFAVPAFALRCLGEMSCLFLDSQRVVPARLQAAGFDFHYEDLQKALADVLA